MTSFELHRILIWGKTYPELSSKYGETVCTGGVLESGQPVRLYPIPFRYLEGEKRFRLYDVIEARIKPAKGDSRPESFRLDPESIKVVDHIEPDPEGWRARAKWMFKSKGWEFPTYDQLERAHEEFSLSIGVIKPLEVLDVRLEPRTEESRESFQNKIAKLTETAHQSYLFETLAAELKELDYMPERPVVKWRCGSKLCGSSKGHALHSMQVTDWGTMELLRREGELAVIDQLAQRLTIEDHDVKFFLGNFRLHPNRFGIVGIWYPKRQLGSQHGTLDLFAEGLD